MPCTSINIIVVITVKSARNTFPFLGIYIYDTRVPCLNASLLDFSFLSLVLNSGGISLLFFYSSNGNFVLYQYLLS